MDEQKYLSLVNDTTVVKSNRLIQQSRFRLNLQQQKIILYLVSQINYNDDDFKLYEFGIMDFCRICGIDSVGGNNYQLLKDSLQQLRDKSLYIMLDDETEALVGWLDKVYLNKRTGTVQIRLDKDLKPYLLHLRENFTRYELVYTLRMKHKVSPRLYEILKSYHYNDLKPYEKEFDIDELRNLLDANKDTYKKFKYFNSFVLTPAIQEINDQTDLHVTATPLRTGRKVYAVRIRIERRDAQGIIESFAKTEEAFRKELVKESAPMQQPEPQEPKEAPRRRDTDAAAEQAAAQDTPIIIMENAAAKEKPKVKEIVPLQAQDKPKRLQVRIYIKGQKEKPIKAFSSYDRSDLDQKTNQWLTEQGYQTYKESTGTSFRWEV